MTASGEFVTIRKTVGNGVFLVKRFLLAAFCAIFFLSFVPFAQAAPPNGTVRASVYDYTRDCYGAEGDLPVITLRLNGAPIRGEMPGVALHTRTLAPLRLLAEGLGAEVEWIPDAAQVSVRHGDDIILLTLGSSVALVNGEARQLPDGVPATMISYRGQGYTMVPLRFFSETFGCQVDWEQRSYTASILAPGALALDTPIHPERYLIALDPGHGGDQSGAYYGETAEKTLNLSITKKLDELLRGLGYRTLLTRTGDESVGLSQRAKLANSAQADLFISIHCNAAAQAPSFQGLYTYHYPTSRAGAALAQSIQTPACAFTGAVNRGIASANFAVVRETSMPAVLVESGFMTCPEELERLRDESYQARLAQGIAQGIIRYLNGKR